MILCLESVIIFRGTWFLHTLSMQSFQFLEDLFVPSYTQKRGTVCHISVIGCLGIPLNEDMVITAPRYMRGDHYANSCIRDLQFPKL